jgi:hypothetical protein
MFEFKAAHNSILVVLWLRRIRYQTLQSQSIWKKNQKSSFAHDVKCGRGRCYKHIVVHELRTHYLLCLLTKNVLIQYPMK